MANKTKPASGVVWDLSDLYESIDDPQIGADKQEITSRIESFKGRFKGNINSPELNAELLLAALQEYESILDSLYRVAYYAMLLHSVDSSDPKIGKFYQEINEFESEFEKDTVWFQLEWLDIDQSLADKLMSDPKLAGYKHHLAHERAFKPFALSEAEEKIMSQKSQTGVTAFVRLYDEFDAGLKYDIEIDGEQKQLPYSGVTNIMRVNPDRDMRQAAAESLSKGLEPHQKLYSFILNTKLLDKKIDDEIRGYEYPQQSTFLGYEVSPEVVESMSTAIQRRYDMCEKFYLAKAKLLGVDQLHEWDRYNGIYPDIKEEVTWEEAKELVMEAFESFDLKMAELAQMYFDHNWIHAEVTDNKRGGAYCGYTVPELHPYVFMNFVGDARDVATLAHELGHGIHAQLSKDNNLLQFWPSTATAEIASVFGEALVFERQYKQASENKHKINLLANKLQDSFSTIFRQNAFYLFEGDIHKHRREKGELTSEEFGRYYQTRTQEMFGKGVELTDQHQSWWMPILHFYHYNFYVFTYAFGETLTNALYARYKLEGDDFVNRYVEALKLGSSKSPLEITQAMGLDITDPEFWNAGLDLIEEYVDEFIQLAAE